MKILMMPTWYVNSHEKVIGIMHKELYMELAKRCEAVVFVTSDNEVNENECKKKVEDGLLTYRICPKREKYKKIKAVFQEILEDFKPDLIHGHAVVGAGRYATYLGRKYLIPVIFPNIQRWNPFGTIINCVFGQIIRIAFALRSHVCRKIWQEN